MAEKGPGGNYYDPQTTQGGAATTAIPAGLFSTSTGKNPQPAQPRKYIGVASPTWDQYGTDAPADLQGQWFLRPGYNYTDPNNYLESGTTDHGAFQPLGTSGISPKYFEGDELMMAGLSPETVASVQAKMAEANLMPKKYAVGVWDGDAIKAFQSVLAFANQTGSDWTYALDKLAQGAAAGGLGSGGGARGPVFTAHLSNPDDIKKVFKQASYNLLGGKFVDDAQADAFTQSFQAQELNSQRAAFNAATGGGGTVTDAPSAGTAAETEITATDPEGVKAKRYDDYANVLASVLSQKAPQI